MSKSEHKKQEVKVNGRWQEVVTIFDNAGDVLSHMVQPLKLEFQLKDVLQVIVGASLLAIPVGFTEETWRLGEVLPLANALWFLVLSLLFIALFTYYNSYKGRMKNHWIAFFKRIIFTYLFSFAIVALLMTLIHQAPWESDWILALKRCLIVTFPCSLSGAVADTIK